MFSWCEWGVSLIIQEYLTDQKRSLTSEQTTKNQYGPKEERTASFRWTIEKFLEFLALQRTKQEPLTKPSL